MPIRTSVDITKAIEGLHSLQKDQIPFALAKSLTATAKDGQAAVKAALPSKFTLRNRFVEGGIRITPAKKNGPRIEADVHTYTANSNSGAPGFMARQESGEERVPVQGRHHIAVPTRYLRQMAPNAIPTELRPRVLLGIVGDRYSTRNKKGQISLVSTRRVRGFVFFLQQMHDGNSAIMGRYFSDRDAYPFYLLIPDAQVRPRLGMAEIVDRVAQANLLKNWEEAWRGIFAKGLRVRF